MVGRRILILGGSGFLSGTLSREALAAGHDVSVVTRGQRPIPAGVTAIQCDRKDQDGFSRAIKSHRPWDLVVDCIGFDAEDAIQDIKVFTGKCDHLAFVSTDFVYDPARRTIPQQEEPAHFTASGYGGNKRKAEEEFLKANCGDLAWTIFRPSHIYGPGSELGCLPLHGRDPDLLSRLKQGQTLRLVHAGRYRQHPVFAPDLAGCILSIPGNSQVDGMILNVANPDVLTSRAYYEIIAQYMDAQLNVQEVDTATFLAENPDKVPFCCDRVYSLAALIKSGLEVPATTIASGLAQHIESLQW